MRETPQERRVLGIGRIAGFVLAGLGVAAVIASILLGPVFLLLLPLIALGVVAVESLLRRQHGQRAAKIARRTDAAGPITFWGRVTAVDGRCPTDRTPEVGDEFVIAERDIRPPVALCEHARQAVLGELAPMERGNSLPIEPVVYQDPQHRVEVELHREPQSIQSAA